MNHHFPVYHTISASSSAAPACSGLLSFLPNPGPCIELQQFAESGIGRAGIVHRLPSTPGSLSSIDTSGSHLTAFKLHQQQPPLCPSSTVSANQARLALPVDPRPAVLGVLINTPPAPPSHKRSSDPLPRPLTLRLSTTCPTLSEPLTAPSSELRPCILSHKEKNC